LHHIHPLLPTHTPRQDPFCLSVLWFS
jgi:hypothetical protein